jgi:uncharacterized membrane protein
MDLNPIAESEEQYARRGDSPVSERELDDARMEIIMGRLLQVGVLLAATVVLLGGIMYIFAHAGERTHYRAFVARPLVLRHPHALLRGLVAGDASAVIQFGILLLVATPICRVLFAVVAFFLEKDRLYVAVSMLVLAVLLFGMLRGG